MMWAEFDYSSFPIVNVVMDGIIENDEEFEDFLDKWRKLYDKKMYFTFIFDTRKVGWVNPKYAYKMTNFISELKNRDKQYLKGSSIIVDSIWIKTLFMIIFSIQSPVCPIEYHNTARTIDVEKLMDKTSLNLDGLRFGLDSRFN